MSSCFFLLRICFLVTFLRSISCLLSSSSHLSPSLRHSGHQQDVGDKETVISNSASPSMSYPAEKPIPTSDPRPWRRSTLDIKTTPQPTPDLLEDTLKEEPIKFDLLKELNIELVEPRTDQSWHSSQYTLFQSGYMAPFFRPCATDAEARTAKGLSVFKYRTCFRDSPFTDRIMFRFSYDPKKLVNGTAIRCQADHLFSDGGVAHSTILGESISTISENDPSIIMTVGYYCLFGAEGPTTLSLRFTASNSTSSESVKLSWQKQCTSGAPSHIELRSSSANGYTTMWPPGDSNSNIRVSPSTTTTSIDVSVEEAFIQQEFLTPYIFVDDETIVHAMIRGSNSNGGVIRSGQTTTFDIVYECKDSSSSTITLTMALPPFSNATIQWEKGKFLTVLVNRTTKYLCELTRIYCVCYEYRMRRKHHEFAHHRNRAR